MDNFLKFISRLEVIISIAVLLIILIIWLFIRKMKANKFKKQLSELEVRYNKISSIPLAFKLNKAVAIARLDNDMMQKVSTYREDFDLATSNLKQISQALADTEDNILMGKLKEAKEGLLDIETSLDLGENQVNKLNGFLDSILEKETEQRATITELKDKFRRLKNEANEKSTYLSHSWTTIEKNISNIENMFSIFEEWMYASEYEKANAELDNIKGSLDNLEIIVKELPDLLQDARGVIPSAIENVNKESLRLKEKGVYLDHINIETNINAIVNSLRTDLENLKMGDATDVKKHLNDYKERLSQISNSLHIEEEANVKLHSLSDESARLVRESFANISYVKSQFEKTSVRFGLENLDKTIEEYEVKLKELNVKQDKVLELINKNDMPASSLTSALNELYQDVSQCNDEFIKMKTKLDSAKSDEERAKKELLKLQLILNQMQIKVKENRLPSISDSYESDLIQAYEYIGSIEKLIDQTPLDIELLNATLKGAIDFIYKLYNNVNNIVGMAIMVENTIVFGNKYRSSYSDIDSDLTRAELCFRNGEYTQALTIAIATIDKIHPGSYEKLVKNNATSAA